MPQVVGAVCDVLEHESVPPPLRAELAALLRSLGQQFPPQMQALGTRAPALMAGVVVLTDAVVTSFSPARQQAFMKASQGHL
jgi:hypothetical protein